MSKEIDDDLVEAATELLPEGILADFVPALVAASAMLVVDDEAVILDETTGATHLLNVTGSLVVQCFDGVSSINEIAVDAAEVFNAAFDIVVEDVLTLCRELGKAGMLQGVRADSHQHAERLQEGLPVGANLRDLDAAMPDGTIIDDEWLRTERTLVVNWGGHCGFCSRIVEELGDLETPLMAVGVRLMLITASAPAQVDTQFTEGGASLPVAFVDETPDFFAGLGTPVAYIVDEGLVVEPLAVGALEVPELARRLAGVAKQSPS